jgi:hypothetical protein
LIEDVKNFAKDIKKAVDIIENGFSKTKITLDRVFELPSKAEKLG